MATVRFSGDLLEKIKERAAETFQDRYNKAHKSEPENFATNFYNWAFADTIHLLKQLPDGFLDTTGSFNINQILMSGSPNVSVQSTFNFGTHVKWPHKIINHKKLINSGWHSYQNMNVVVDPSDPVGVEFYNFFSDRDSKMRLLLEQRTKFVQGVMSVCGSYTTLAPALKAWPPLWDLVPEEYKQRHLEVKERKAAPTAAELAIDLNNLTATVVASKLVR